MGYGQVLAKRLDDNMYIVQLEWKLAQGQKARIYTKHLLWIIVVSYIKSRHTLGEKERERERERDNFKKSNTLKI